MPLACARCRWTGYPCSSASAYGYTAAEVADLESSCPITCGTPCAAPVASSPPPAALLPFGQTTSCPSWCNAYTTTNPLCFGCDAMGNPAVAAPSPAVAAPCVDSTTYIANGYTCAAWAGYSCSTAGKDAGGAHEPGAHEPKKSPASARAAGRCCRRWVLSAAEALCRAS